MSAASHMPIVTLDQLRALNPGSTYNIKVRDIDGVNPESRGKTFKVVFKGLDIDRHLGESEPGVISFSATVYMVHCYDAENTHLQYSFHAWLIEEMMNA